MKSNNLKEQPQNLSSQNSIVNEIVNEGEAELGFEGSLLGKFKDVKSLADAYSNLQSEFTRKSQRLSVLEKRDNLMQKNIKSTEIKLENNSFPNLETDAMNSINYSNENLVKRNEIENNKTNSFINKSNNLNVHKEENLNNENNNEVSVDNAELVLNSSNLTTMQTNEFAENKAIFNNSANKTENELETQGIKPRYLNENWSETVNKFFETNKKAVKFSSDIAKEILSDKTLENNPSSLEIAYMRVLQKNYVSKSDILNDEEFVNEFVLKNEKIARKIINHYLLAMKEKTTPTLITGKKVGGVGLTPQEKPKSLEEAKQLVELIFK